MIDEALEKFINEHLNESLEKVIFKVRSRFTVDPKFVMNQINGRKKTPAKIPSWAKANGLLFPSILSFEQCSSEHTARYKANLVDGTTLADLTGGFGVDTFFFAQKMAQVDYVEKNKDLADLVKNNFQKLNISNVSFYVENSLDFLVQKKEKLDWIYVDPSRRNSEKGKVFLIEDCEPNIIDNLELLLSKAKQLLIKFSPMLDLEEIVKKIKGVRQITVLSVKNECKEVLVHVDGVARNAPQIEIAAVNINAQNKQELFISNCDQKNNTPAVFNAPATYIYEPNKSILKAGIQNHLAKELGLQKIASNSNFFTSDHQIDSFPGRVFLKKDITKGKEKQIKKFLLDGKANVIARNYPLNATQIYQKLKIIPGGTVYLLATTLNNDSKVILVCERMK